MAGSDCLGGWRCPRGSRQPVTAALWPPCWAATGLLSAPRCPSVCISHISFAQCSPRGFRLGSRGGPAVTALGLCAGESVLHSRCPNSSVTSVPSGCLMVSLCVSRVPVSLCTCVCAHVCARTCVHLSRVCSRVCVHAHACDMCSLVYTGTLELLPCRRCGLQSQKH